MSQELVPYRLDIGDVVELSVTGIPDFRQRLTVDLSGHIQVPIAGSLKVAGAVLDDVQRSIRGALSSGFYQQRLSDGRSIPLAILSEDVVLRILEYRPVYLLGDVNRAGEQPYRPGMTVLQAVALGGGYDIQRFRMANPMLEAADLRGDLNVLRTNLARGQVVVERLEAELSGVAVFVPKLEGITIATDLLREIVKTEVQQFETRQDEYRSELAFLQRLIEQAEAKLRTLLEQQRREEEGARADAEEADRLRALVQRGISNTARAVETRRTSLLSSTRALQTSVEVEQTRREKEELARRLEQLTTRRRLDTLREFQEANVQLATVKARLGAAGEKAFYTGALRSQLVQGRGGRPDITIVRREEGGRTRRVADETMQLLPGDVVEVALVIDQAGVTENRTQGERQD